MISSDDGFDDLGDVVVTTVVDQDAARPLVETLLLAGLGPSLRESPSGLQVTVVEGQGERARQALGLAPAPSARDQATGGRGGIPGTASSSCSGLSPSRTSTV